MIVGEAPANRTRPFHPDTDGGSIVRQTAVFEPAGLTGLIYWYGIYPLHLRVFAGMLSGVAARALKADGTLANFH